MNILVRYRLTGRNAREIAASVESAVRAGGLGPGDHLPPVRELAERLGVSPTTVAAAYADLRRRGITIGAGRAGTRIRSGPPVSSRVYLAPPAGTRDLLTGGPDPALLPVLPPRPQSRTSRLYSGASIAPRLRELAADAFSADGVDPDNMAVTGGALDGIERVLATWLTPGDRVVVEDPGHAVTFDLTAAMGFGVSPAPVDELGIQPAGLAAALSRGAGAVILTPRAQAATGAAWDAGRAAEISAVLRDHPSVAVIEDDHAGPVSGVPVWSVTADRDRWATIRSVSKSLGPDLRLAVLAGDETTVARVTGRQALGTGWVSYQLQETVAELWSDPAAGQALAEAAQAYQGRRTALRSALATHGISMTGRSGFTCWLPVADEDGVASALATAGGAVAQRAAVPDSRPARHQDQLLHTRHRTRARIRRRPGQSPAPPSLPPRLASPPSSREKHHCPKHLPCPASDQPRSATAPVRIYPVRIWPVRAGPYYPVDICPSSPPLLDRLTDHAQLHSVTNDLKHYHPERSCPLLIAPKRPCRCALPGASCPVRLVRSVLARSARSLQPPPRAIPSYIALRIEGKRVGGCAGWPERR